MIKSRSILFDHCTESFYSFTALCSTPARVPMLQIRAACWQQVCIIAFPYSPRAAAAAAT